MTEDSARKLLARVTCTNLVELEHRNGIAWTAHILLDGVYSGTAEHKGMGGPVSFLADKVVTDRLELDFSEASNRSLEIAQALMQLPTPFPLQIMGYGAYECDVFAWLEPTYEGRPMTLLDAYDLMHTPVTYERQV